MASSFSAFSIGEIFSGIEPIIGSLSPLVSGDASNIKDNNSLMYFPSSVPDVFFFPIPIYVTLEKFVRIYVFNLLLWI